MDSKLRLENGIASQRFIVTAEKLATLKRVFDAICHEFKIPLAAKSERNDLANKIWIAAKTIEHEPLLLIFARNAVASYRR